MTSYRVMIAAASAALLLGASSLGANSLEVKAGVGGVNANVSVGGNNTAQAKASVGNAANATATVGGGGGNVASTRATVGNSNVTANVGTGNGPLATSTTSGNPNGGLTSGTSVNLGGLFGGGTALPGAVEPGNGGGLGGGGGNGGGGNGGGGNGSGGIAPASVQAAVGGMSPGEIATMKRQCNSILAMPMAYDDGLIELCKVLRRL